MIVSGLHIQMLLFLFVWVLHLVIAGEPVDIYIHLCRKLFLDTLFLHSLGCFIYLSVMEDEQCKPKIKHYFLYKWNLNAYSNILFSLCADTTHNLLSRTCLFLILPCFSKPNTTPTTTFYCWLTWESSVVNPGSMDSSSVLFYCIFGDDSYFKCMPFSCLYL